MSTQRAPHCSRRIRSNGSGTWAGTGSGAVAARSEVRGLLKTSSNSRGPTWVYRAARVKT